MFPFSVPQPTDSNIDSLWRPRHPAWRTVPGQPEPTGQSQSGGDERGGACVLPGRPGHLARGSSGVPPDAVRVSQCVVDC